MQRNSFLVFVLCSILVLNIIAIVLLNNHLADEEQHTQDVPVLAPPAISPTETLPLVRTLMLEDKTHCPDCYDIHQYIDALKDSVHVQAETAPTAAVSFFHAARLPALAFNATFANYTWLLEGWDQVGTIVNIPDGEYKGTWYVLPTQTPPYMTPDAVVHGRVTVTYVNLSSCKECYDVFSTRAFMNSSRITPYKEIVVDANSAVGKAIVAKYNITAVPTIIFSKEAAEYTNLQPGWNVVGTVEPDGSYVLRSLQRMNAVYYDLEHKRLMKP